MMNVLHRLGVFDLFFAYVHRAVVRNVIQPSPAMKALDVGCGAGGISVLLAESITDGVVVALDPEGQYLRHTRKLARQAGFGQRLVCSLGDVEKLQFVASEFDLI